MSIERLKLAHSIVHDQPDEALAICNEVLNDHIDDEIAQRALFMSGYIMMEAERYGLAFNIYQRCAQLNPRQSDIWSNMGMCLEELDTERAKMMFERAYSLDNRNHRALANHGLMCLLTGQPERCIELSAKALNLDPELRAAKHNMGLAQIMLRQWREGWKNYADTLGVKHREARDYGVPDWNGEPGTVLVYGEQGVGDEIMFASCLADLSKTNKIVFDCDSRLEGLFARSFDFPVYGDRFKKESRAADQQVDYQCAIGQLPSFYRNSDAAFPGRPYLTPDPERCIQWRALFDTFKGRKIGIAWRGGLKNTGEARRSLELSDLEPLFNDRDTFISLEYKPVHKAELDKYGIKPYPRATAKGGDIDDLAALINELDIVICCCTAVFHIAGALGKRCYVIAPTAPPYIMCKTGDLPWYHSVKTFRQKQGESWAKTITRFVESGTYD